MGTVYKRPEGGWQYRWRDPEGKQRKRNFDRKTDAERFGVKIASDLQQNVYVDPAKGRQTFRAFAEGWRANAEQSPNYAAGVESTLRLHVYPVIGGIAIADVSEDDIKKLRAALVGKGFVPTTVRNYLNLVRSIFKAAVRKRVVSHSPCGEVKAPKAQRDPVSPLDEYAVGSLLTNIEPRYFALVHSAASTGGRQGEIFGIKDEDITWDRGHGAVQFRRQLQVERGKGIVVRPLKDYESRKVRVPDLTLDIWAEHISTYGLHPEGFLFTRAGGGLMHARMFNARPWARARSAAAAEWELAADADSDHVRAARTRRRAAQLRAAGFHDLRDFYVSGLIRRGASVSAVSALVGHASQSTTLRHYAHLWEDEADRTRDLVADSLAAITPRVPSVCPGEIN